VAAVVVLGDKQEEHQMEDTLISLPVMVDKAAVVVDHHHR
tara:strand:- start:6 stop:125 length:120 start_codon:yes stop_codon:yes gene_type:complete